MLIIFVTVNFNDTQITLRNMDLSSQQLTQDAQCLSLTDEMSS